MRCPKSGSLVDPDEDCRSGSYEKDYDGYYYCDYFDGFQTTGKRGMLCIWPESDAAERERDDSEPPDWYEHNRAWQPDSQQAEAVDDGEVPF